MQFPLSNEVDCISLSLEGGLHFSTIHAKLHFPLLIRESHFSATSAKVQSLLSNEVDCISLSLEGGLHFSTTHAKLHFPLFIRELDFSATSAKVPFPLCNKIDCPSPHDGLNCNALLCEWWFSL